MPLSIGRSLAGVTAGLALSISLTGCGGASPDEKSAAKTPETPLAAAQAALRQASAKTAALSTYHASVSFAGKNEDAHSDLHAEIAFRQKPDLATQVDAPELHGGYTHVLLNDRFYMRTNDEATQTPWTGVSLSGLRQRGIDISFLQSEIHQADPWVYALMFTASRDVHATGTETIDGVPTTHYQGGFAFADAMTRLSAEQRAEMRPLWETPAGSGTVRFSIWIDARHLVHRITVATPSKKRAWQNATLSYAAFDAPVDITAPPPAQVRDRTKVTRDDLDLPF